MSTERLSELVIPEEPVDPEQLIQFLNPYLRIASDGDRFYLQDQYSHLSAREKILVILSGELARHSLGLSADEWLTPVEIARLADLNLGTAYPALRSLEQDGFVENDTGRYRISPSEFDSAVKKVDR